MRNLILILLIMPALASAQGFDIYVFNLNAGFALHKQVTDRAGYDNQPAFTHDGKALLFSSDRAGDQTDVFRYQIDDGSLTNLTQSDDENEFSPQAWGSEHYTYVLQEGVPYQHLWQRAWKDGGAERALTSYVPVGYYARNDKGILFWARYAYSLFWEPAGAEVGPGAGESLFVIDQAGRSLHSIPGSDQFSFVHKQSNWNWVIKSLDPTTGAITPLISISSRNEDYCWTPDGVMLTADGAKLMRFKPGEEPQWQQLAELSAPGLNEGGRCSVSPDGQFLALVNRRQ